MSSNLEEPNLDNERSAQSLVSAQEVDKGSKRGEYKKRAKCWIHFTITYINQVRHGVCNYCGKIVPADPKNNGTTPMNSHYKKCKLNPGNQPSAQANLYVDETENENGKVNGTVMSWKLDAEAIRKCIAYMIIVDELPFKHVEGKGFQKLMKTICPTFRIPSRWTVSRDCYQLYLDGRIQLKNLLKNNKSRICLTTDTWTSIQRINYMCLTAHYIDNDWNLKKKILNFCPIASHKGSEIGMAIESCLLDWGVDNILTITVDNASSNDTAVQYLKGKLQNWGKALLDGKWLHVRCIAHIVNLIVTDGIKEVGKSIDNIRATVRYVRQSPARLKKFKECVAAKKIESKKLLCLDVSTRWNSTYLMLESAQNFERAFERLRVVDHCMHTELENVPTKFDWESARNLVLFLESFYQITLNVSGTKYVTANNFFNEISHIHSTLHDMAADNETSLNSMAMSMKAKYDKYWGNIEKMNMLIFIASIVDPRNKFEYLKFVLCEMYGEVDGIKLAGLAKDALVDMFCEYEKGSNVADPKSRPKNSTYSPMAGSSKGRGAIEEDSSKIINHKYKLQFKKRMLELGGRDTKSELDKYLEEAAEDDDNLDILMWWKGNSLRFPILSKLARDVLAIPISTVASESAFSTGGRVLDQFRSSLTPRIVQALLCAEDWLRTSNEEINIEESLEELEAFESEILKTGDESTIVDV